MPNIIASTLSTARAARQTIASADINALATAVNALDTARGQANGLAGLDSGSQVPVAQLGGTAPSAGYGLLKSDRTWVQIGPTYYNGESYGMVRGGSASTNDTRLSTITTAMATNPGKLYLPGGTWPISSQIVIPHASGIISDAGQAAVLAPTSALADHVITGFSDGTSANAKYITLEGFAIDCRSMSAGAFDAIHLAGTGTSGGLGSALGDQDFHQLVRDLYILSAPQDGVFMSGRGESGVERVHVFHAGRYGFNISTDSYLSNCTSAMSGEYGFNVRTSPQRLINCKSFYSGNTTAANGAGFFITGSSLGSGTILLVGCESQDNKAEGYKFSNTGSFTAVHMVGCGADSNSTSSSGTYPALSLSSINRGRFELVCMERQNPGTMLYALSTASSNYNTIQMTHQATGGGTAVTPILSVDTHTNNITFGASGGGCEAISSAASITPDPTKSKTKRTILTQNLTINDVATGFKWDGCEITFILIQDGTGGWTTTFNSAYKVGTAWVPVTTANKINTITFVYDGTASIWRQTGQALGL